jgi:integrase
MRTAALTQLGFVDAAKAWLETRKPYLAPRTWQGYDDYIKILGTFFAETRLPEITGDHLRAYQKMRMVRAGASIINHECSVVRQILKRIGMPLIDYQPLPLPKESPHRALTQAEEDRLYRVGAENPQWDVAFCAFVISINTSCGPGEMRHIRLMDIELDQRVLRVQPEGAKRDSRIRRIPLNDEAWKAINYLLKRAQELGVTEPHHYLIPFRVKRGTYDPERPAKGWRTSHDQLLGAAGIDVSPYSGRHHCITKLLENENVSEQTVEAIAGHVSAKMKQRYAHIRMEARREAVEALNAIRKPVQKESKSPTDVFLSEPKYLKFR